MSFLNATVTDVKSSDTLHIVEFSHNENLLSMMSLDLNEMIQKGTKVKLLIKPMHIALGKSVMGMLSYSNQLKSTITSIETGELLSSINLKLGKTTLESVITKKSAQSMNLQVGDDIMAFIKASDLSIYEILDD
ncbi:MAG: TOBE domain-containing protein [Campylobacterota bacterium]|nr:TOBE domain-containing protein [Campylobacterota bacterium]